MNTPFAMIANLPDPVIQRKAAALAKNYKPTVADQLEMAKELVLELYLRGMQESALAVCNVLGREEFNGNFNLWTWVQGALFLKCWILEQQHQYEEKETTLRKITAAFDFGTDELKKSVNHNARERRLNGSLLKDDEIEAALAENDRKSELEWRKYQFSELLFIYFLGGSEAYPTDKVVALIKENETIIRLLMQ